MCGGVGYKIKKVSKEELEKYYSPELIKRFETSGRVESFFWEKNAVLPVKAHDHVQLMLWGNKDEGVNLPKTGWAKEESLKIGKWNHLDPEIVDIPVDAGYEKKVWFDMPKGTKGIVVKKDGAQRVYIMTKEACPEYREETGHDREPLGEKEYKNKNLNISCP